MKKVLVAVPHSHTYLWTQTCLSCLHRNPPRADDVEAQIVVIDNSWDWSPAIRGITDTRLGEGVTVVNNPKPNKFHASALDVIIERFDFDYLMALETDVLVLQADWLQWFLSQLSGADYAVGHWHHEQFVNPSCTLYRGSVLRDCDAWCKANGSLDMRWGEGFAETKPLDSEDMRISVSGAFAEKRGWPAGTHLREPPSGQRKGPGWYEPGQQLHHWAVEAGYGYKVCETQTTERVRGLPTQTLYRFPSPPPGSNFEPAELFECGAVAVHLWGGTRALDILKHKIDLDQFVQQHAAFWQAREAHFWRCIVPEDIQAQTLDLIRTHGWHTKGAGTPDVTDRDREAVDWVQGHYREGGVTI